LAGGKPVLVVPNIVTARLAGDVEKVAGFDLLPVVHDCYFYFNFEILAPPLLALGGGAGLLFGWFVKFNEFFHTVTLANWGR
jgi:hypothetical protein